MKIKKYTIDQEIPRGAVFMFKETEDYSSSSARRVTDYFYFLVEEEKTPVSELSIIKGIENLEEDY